MLYSTLPLFSLQSETKEIPLTQGQVAIVDAADYEWLMQWKWYALRRHDGRTYYAGREARLEDGSVVGLRMHRVILGIKDPRLEVDHVDGNGLNNERANLRVASHSQNVLNKHIYRNNSSGYKGVSLRSGGSSWRAYINVNGKRRYLGNYSTPAEAAEAYNRAALKYHGEYAKLNQV